MKKVLLLAYTICVMPLAYAQGVLKEGKITLTASVNDTGRYAPRNVIGKTIYFKNGSVRSEIIFKINYRTSNAIYNKQKKEGYNVFTGKYGYILKTLPEEIGNLENDFGLAPDVKETKDTKVILGYHCKHAILYFHPDTLVHAFDCWYTNEIEATNPAFEMYGYVNYIDGFPMEITTREGNTTYITWTATAVEKTMVPDSLFNIPAGTQLPVKIRQDLNDDFKPNNGADNSFKYGTWLPDIELPDVNGWPLKLSTLRGQYVLVDLWASWCIPCREENPNVVDAYNKYKDKGFTVYSISLDEKKKDWVKAIAKDNLTWPSHVCDFMGRKSPVVKQFCGYGIPSNYLLDKDGKVIAQNLRGNQLELVLKRYLN